MRFLLMLTSSVIINDFQLFGIAMAPFKTNTPLIVYANAPLPFPFPLQGLKSV